MNFIIDFVDTTTDEAVAKYLSDNSATIVSEFSSLGKCYLVSCDTTPPMADCISTIVDDSAHPISLLSYTIPEGKTFPQIDIEVAQDANWWKLASLDRPNLDVTTQTIDRRGNTATVYVVDSGIMKDHPEFVDATISELYSLNDDFKDYAGHGTAIASLISGSECGITDAKLVSVKIFQPEVETLQSHLLAAFDAIIADVNANPFTMPIVNLSWSIPKNAFIESKIKLLVNSGVFVVAAAGNSGQAIEDVTPASMPEVFVVGAFSPEYVPCDFSNYTGDIATTTGTVNTGVLDVWAPGSDLRVAMLDGGYTIAGGTSLAAAIQSAAIAYNSNSYVLDDNSAPSVLFNEQESNALSSIMDSDLIYLDGKYQYSKHTKTYFAATYDGENGANYATVSNFNASCFSGDKMEKQAFPFYIVESYSIEKELPAGFSINNGWLVGTMTTDEPFYWESPVTYTKLNGFVKQAVMRIAVLPQGFDESTIQPDDPIAVTLQACLSTHTTYYYCSGTCSSGFCHDACNQQNAKDPASIYCTCVNSQCP